MKYIVPLVALLLATIVDSNVLKHRLLPKEAQRIYNGTDVPDGGAPYQVAVYRNGAFLCGGSLISSTAVLTAAKCAYPHDSTSSLFTVRYGSLKLNEGTVANVSRITLHPKFNAATSDYDVAILHLTMPFTVGTNAAIIPLANSQPSAGELVTIFGWGWLNLSSDAWSEHLQQADQLQVLSAEDCQKWANQFPLTDRMLCVFSSYQTALPGDFGGPMVHKGELVGVASFVVFLSNIDENGTHIQYSYITGYTKVNEVRDWIESDGNSALGMTATSTLAIVTCISAVLISNCIFIIN